jgi:multiple sugar transport system ATP-binding protein
MNEVPPRHRDIAMVFQSYALYPHMTGRRGTWASHGDRARPRPSARARWAGGRDVLGLRPCSTAFPAQLSGGQRQRVAMGRALVRRAPGVPVRRAALEPRRRLRVEMRLEIARLHQRSGTTTVYVTHDQVEAMTLADRIVVMNGGRIQQVGSPMELYDRPANRFVAGFIGSPTMNVLAGTPVPGGLKLGDGTIWPAPPGTASLGIRPEHLSLSPTPVPSLTADLLVVERLGSDTNLFCEVKGIGPLLARAHGNVDLAPGAKVELWPEPARLHPFGADGRRAEVQAKATVGRIPSPA